MQLTSLDGHEVHVVDGKVTAIAGIAIDQVDEASADALDRGNVELHRADLAVERLGAEIQRALVSLGCVLHAHGERAHRRTVHSRERLREAVGIAVYDEVHLPLPVQHHVLGPMARDGREAHLLEEVPEQLGIRCGVLDELETVGPHGVVVQARRVHGCARVWEGHFTPDAA